MSAQDPETLAEVAADVDMAEEEVQAIFADVQEVLESLADLDVDVEDPADLERVRQQLPTKPIRAQMVYASLPAPLHNALEFVSASDRQAAYWRRSRERSDFSAVSDAELVKYWKFSQAAKKVRGQTGTVRTSDGREIPAAAAEIGNRMEVAEIDPETGPDDETREKGKALLQRISDWL